MHMNRRRFLEWSGASLAALSSPGSLIARSQQARLSRELSADLVVIGGGLGGCSAALAALKAGKSVILTDPTDWIGGQLTSQAVPPDENAWIEQPNMGSSRSYRALRQAIRDYYRLHYPLTAEALNSPRLNPGSGNVSRLCHEPRVALAVLTALFAPFASVGKLSILLEHEPAAADVAADRVRAVTVRDLRSGEQRTLIAPYFLDASELGDLLPLAGAEFVIGFESKRDTGELHAPEQAQPTNQQAITCCFAMDNIEGGDFTIDRPADYAFWQAYRPDLEPAWPGPLLSLTDKQPVTLESRTHKFDPRGKGAGLFNYRRIADPANFAQGFYAGGITLVNWPQNDYYLGPLVGVSAQEAQRHAAKARELSLCLLYWLQTEAPRPEGGTGWKGLRLRPDLVGTTDGLAKHPYIRESRRIKAEFTVVEEHVGAQARRAKLGVQDVAAEQFPDTVGVGHYRIDLHPSTGRNNYIDVESLPFQIPLGALIPVRLENLLPACKNLGVTHITNGCYRLHPVEWGIGEAAGTLAAYCIGQKLTPRAVRSTPQHAADFQARLQGQGVDLAWPNAGRPPRPA
jgi:hypothetical protein